MYAPKTGADFSMKERILDILRSRAKEKHGDGLIEIPIPLKKAVWLLKNKLHFLFWYNHPFTGSTHVEKYTLEEPMKIIECTECNYDAFLEQDKVTNPCPDCGADMKITEMPEVENE